MFFLYIYQILILIMEKFIRLKSLLSDIETDVEKFYIAIMVLLEAGFAKQCKILKPSRGIFVRKSPN